MKSPEESNAEAVTPMVLTWAAWATGGRLLLTTAAHYLEAAFQWQFVIGLGVCALGGALYARAVRRTRGDALWHGGMIGAIAAFLGTAVAVALADQPLVALLLGTLAGIGLGAAGGGAAHAMLK